MLNLIDSLGMCASQEGDFGKKNHMEVEELEFEPFKLLEFEPFKLPMSVNP